MAGGHGGRRENSGRKIGGSNSKRLEIIEKAASNGITPLEVMIEAMRHFHKRGELLEASRIAKDAAPYMHPRLTTIEHGTKDGKPLLDNTVVIYGGVLIKNETVALLSNGEDETKSLPAESGENPTLALPHKPEE